MVFIDECPTTRDEALSLVRDGHAEVVVVDRPAIASPDLAYCWQDDPPLNSPDASTFHGADPEGYTHSLPFEPS